MPNVLIGLMPEEVTRELAQAGAEFSIGAGKAVPAEHLDGNFIFVVESGIASQCLRSDSGRLSEVGMVGREGVFPIAAALQVPVGPHLVVVQIGPLTGRRIRTREFHAIVGGDDCSRWLLRAYSYSFVIQLGTNILSSEQNAVIQRIARWLLMCHDRINGDRLVITHDMLAQMAFSHRPTVTNLLQRMREDGLVDLARGEVRILDRDGLDRLADGAYGLSEAYLTQHVAPFGKDCSRPHTSSPP